MNNFSSFWVYLKVWFQIFPARNVHKNSQQLGKDKVSSGTDIFSRLAWAQKMFSFSDHCSWFHEIAELMNNIQYQPLGPPGRSVPLSHTQVTNFSELLLALR